MATCEQCGNDYARSFEIHTGGSRHTFDCFECAISALAPNCGNCGCRIVGHGIDGDDGTMYCCAHCERHAQRQMELNAGSARAG